MDLFQSQNNKISSLKHNNKNNKKKKSSTRLTKDQVRLLERSFISNRNLEPERKARLAEELGIPPRQVAVWYQNKRARWRTQSLELDCGTLQVRLENALAEKRQLEREVDRLRGELQKAKEMLDQFATTTTTTTTICSIDSSWCEEGIRSSTGYYNNYQDQDHDHDHVMIDHDQVLQLDYELFPHLMGTDYDRVVHDL
ncbi:Homeobox-leucine zipper protein ATHB-52 [Morus notabilis]|uniref:Homeobox-leucine zipper protein n=1 Tax=Morus notabilis TaxID=981085 RepID=W9RW21_9ROSA|nr:homeobox-leucine zipper protein ATHB-52 [Morus notabilis]EXB75034.1 Homeobox-leucine zipper protein ATHB-52 [Morus notabilis]